MNAAHVYSLYKEASPTVTSAHPQKAELYLCHNEWEVEKSGHQEAKDETNKRVQLNFQVKEL